MGQQGPPDPAWTGLVVPVEPLAGGRRPRAPWIVLAILVAVIVLAVAASRLFPVGPAPGVAVGPSGRPGATATAAPTELAPVDGLAAAALRDGLGNGTLAGTVVVVQGGMERVPVPCDRVRQCTILQLVGLDGVPVVVDPAMVAADEVPRGTMAFRAGSGVLTYLGTLHGDLDRPDTVEGFVTDPLGAGPDVPPKDVLAPVSGWLVVGGVRACDRPSGGPPCLPTSPWLTDDQPTAEGVLVSEQGLPVQVDQRARRRKDQVVTHGPFLLRYASTDAGGLPPWRVVALLDPQQLVRVTLP